MNLFEGQKLIQQKKFSKALEFFLILENQKNLDEKVFFYLALIYFELNEYEKSIVYYKKYLKKNENSSSALYNLAIVKQTIGDFFSAKKIYKNLIEINETNVRAYYGLYLLDEKKFFDKNFDNLLKLKENNNLTLYEKGILNFLLSKNEKKKKNLKNEINYLSKSHKNIFYANEQYNNSSQFYYSEIASKNFNKIKIKGNSNNINFKPIFIIGLPRSGSTLIESILTSGSEKICSFGECHIFNTTIVEEISHVIFSNKFNKNKFKIEFDSNAICEKVLAKYFQISGVNIYENNKFIDKSLENFFNIELIIKLFPKAKFLHTHRNITDSIISIYQSMLPELSWAHSIESILKYMDNYFKILAYFKKKYPNIIYDVKLENLTEDTELITKKIFKFCDLIWDDKILDFYKRRDLFSKTLSLNQIRSKVTKYDIDKYKPYQSLLTEYKNNYRWLKI